MADAQGQGRAPDGRFTVLWISAAIRTRESERAGLVDRIRALETPQLDSADMRRELAAIVADHREALISNPPESRDLLKVLIEDRLVAHHLNDAGEWELRGTGTLEPLVIRAAQNLASLTPASWNQIDTWLRQVEALRQPA